MKYKAALLAAVVLTLVSCHKGPEDLIVGTWRLTSVMHQSTGHPDQSLNGRTTTTYNEGEETTTMIFNEDGRGYRVEFWSVYDSTYIFVPDTVYLEDTMYVQEVIQYIDDTTYILYDSMEFSYFATGNLLNIQEGNLQKNYRIDKLDKKELVITDTNIYIDTYTNSYGRSMEFTQETKTVMSFIRR